MTNLALDLDFTPAGLPVDVHSYDWCVVFFSSGKDSLACVLYLLELGVPPERILLHHHLVDGVEGSTLMDWPVTESYCQAVADHLGLELAFSWKAGGFEREMLKDNAPTAPVHIETPEGIKTIGGNRGRPGTRLKFPQKTADLQQRWCSAALKVDVGRPALRHDPRFTGAGVRTLAVTGERAEESANRARYAAVEVHNADLREAKRKAPRHIDAWRPVLRWSEAEVWEILRRWRIRPHPAYQLGFGRTSCQFCIFGSPDQWASLRLIDPERFAAIADYEQQFGLTIDRKRSVHAMADAGTPYPMDPDTVRLALSERYTLPVRMDPWELPAGAYGDSAGPT